MSSKKSENRFQILFKDKQYISLKNYLYNFLLRKKAVKAALKGQATERIIEIGSGLSPVTHAASEVLYTDLSYTGLRLMKDRLNRGNYVVADGTALPFKSNHFSCCICSEVIEHIENDAKALHEMARITRPQGNMILTFPHRRAYFSNDDRYVNHYRRYNLPDIKKLLIEAGFQPIRITKVLGPLEKVTMSSVIYLMTLFNEIGYGVSEPQKNGFTSPWEVLFFKWLNRFYMMLIWADAKIMPLSMSSVLLIKSKKF